MFSVDQYRLIDFGGGEKLERFGNRTIRRATPSAMASPRANRSWNSDAAFERNYRTGYGQWKFHGAPSDAWSIKHKGKRFLLKQAPSGQVGVFPEQAANWDWVERRSGLIAGRNALNLFAYTGGTTMALASCGASVTHVDAAKPAVAWARDNAVASGLESAPIRWIVDDAIAFMKREIKRGRKYQIVVADPPSFGRGPGKDIWKIQRDMEPLIELVHQLTDKELSMLILSCHTPGIDADNLARYAQRIAPIGSGLREQLELNLVSQSGDTLRSGDCFRWCNR